MLGAVERELERDTDALGKIPVRQEILLLYKIGLAVDSQAYKEALNFLRELELEKQSHFRNQMRLVEAHCHRGMGNFLKAEEICSTIVENLNEEEEDLTTSMGVYTMMIAMIVEGYESKLNAKSCLEGLLTSLRPQFMRIYLLGVMATLTGCQSFRSLSNVRDLGGQDDRRKALKLQILANWKFLADQQRDGVQLKQKALTLWKQLNCYEQTKKCLLELKQLEGTATGPYLQKLKKLRYFVRPLIKLEIESEGKLNNKQPLLKWCLPLMLATFTPPPDNEQLIKSKSVIGQSRMQKENTRKEQLNYIYEESAAFCEEYSRERGGEVTNLLLKSRFMDEQIKYARKALSIMTKLRSSRLRYALSTFLFAWEQCKSD